MSKKNKGGKTPSAKAARNLEALKKAKANVEASAEVKELKEAPVVEEKKEEPKPEPKPTPAPKKTAYESYLEFRKHPHMCMLSQKVEKNVEIIHTEWKNSETNEITTHAFSASFVKKGDGIDLKQLREQAEKGMKEYWAEHAVKPKTEEPTIEKPVVEEVKPESKPEPKPEPKKEEKKPAAKKPAKEKVIVPEVVQPEEMKPKVTVPVNNRPQPTDRIDANHGIELMKSFEKRAEEIEKGTELHRAMREQADVMLFVYGKKWIDQCIADGDEAFIKVSQNMYNRIAQIGQELLGITVKALPVPGSDGQMKIDFKETIETAPAEIKEAIEEDAKKEVPTDTIPIANIEDSEEQKIKAIDSILRMKNGMDGTLVNAIQFARNAFPELKDAYTAQVIAFIYSKVEHSTLLNAYANAVIGNLCGNANIFSAHTWLKQRLSAFDFNDVEIAAMTKVMLANALNNRKAEKDYATMSATCNRLLKQMNDDLINRIINAKTPKDEAKLKISGKYLELGKVETLVPATKVINALKLTYGSEQSSKLLKQQMQRINALYSDGLKPLEVYVEKSTYVTKK